MRNNTHHFAPGKYRSAVIQLGADAHRQAHHSRQIGMFAGAEGNGTPLQYSCLENPMDGGAQKAAVHGVAEGRT